MIISACDSIIKGNGLFEGKNNLGKLETDILSLNIRSMRANFEEFKVCYLNKITIKPKIIVLVETWIKDYEVNAYSLTGYKLYYDCKKVGRSGGVLIYVNNNLSTKEVSINLGEGTEAVALECKIKYDSIWTTIIGIYRSPSVKKSEFINNLEQWLNANKVDNTALMIGDMNIDMNTVGKDKWSDAYSELMVENGFFYFDTGPTRVDVKQKKI